MIFRIVFLKVPVHKHHGILEFVADLLKGVFNPALAYF